MHVALGALGRGPFNVEGLTDTTDTGAGFVLAHEVHPGRNDPSWVRTDFRHVCELHVTDHVVEGTPQPSDLRRLNDDEYGLAGSNAVPDEVRDVLYELVVALVEQGLVAEVAGQVCAR